MTTTISVTAAVNADATHVAVGIASAAMLSIGQLVYFTSVDVLTSQQVTAITSGTSLNATVFRVLGQLTGSYTSGGTVTIQTNYSAANEVEVSPMGNEVLVGPAGPGGTFPSGKLYDSSGVDIVWNSGPRGTPSGTNYLPTDSCTAHLTGTSSAGGMGTGQGAADSASLCRWTTSAGGGLTVDGAAYVFGGVGDHQLFSDPTAGSNGYHDYTTDPATFHSTPGTFYSQTKYGGYVFSLVPDPMGYKSNNNDGINGNNSMPAPAHGWFLMRGVWQFSIALDCGFSGIAMFSALPVRAHGTQDLTLYVASGGINTDASIRLVCSPGSGSQSATIDIDLAADALWKPYAVLIAEQVQSGIAAGAAVIDLSVTMTRLS